MKDFGQAQKSPSSRQAFLKKGMAASGVTVRAGILTTSSAVLADDDGDQERIGRLAGDAAILRFLAAAEIIDSGLWLHYQQLATVLDDEAAQLAHAARRKH